MVTLAFEHARAALRLLARLGLELIVVGGIFSLLLGAHKLGAHLGEGPLGIGARNAQRRELGDDVLDPPSELAALRGKHLDLFPGAQCACLELLDAQLVTLGGFGERRRLLRDRLVSSFQLGSEPLTLSRQVRASRSGPLELCLGLLEVERRLGASGFGGFEQGRDAGTFGTERGEVGILGLHPIGQRESVAIGLCEFVRAPWRARLALALARPLDLSPATLSPSAWAALRSEVAAISARSDIRSSSSP